MPSAVMRQSLVTQQKLSLSPQMRNSLELLHATTQELEAAIEEAVQNNPFLEYSETPSSDADTESPAPTPSDDEPTLYDRSQRSFISDTRPEFMTWADTNRRGEDDDSPQEFELIANRETLSDFLSAQLGEVMLDDTHRNCVRWLIGNLDENGFLPTPLQEIASDAPFYADEAIWQAALATLQDFDPAGVGAQDVIDALHLQTQRAMREAQIDRTTANCALQLLNKADLTLLARHDYARLSRLTDASRATIESAVSFIATLSPHPASRWDIPLDRNAIIPDILVSRTDQGWSAQLNAQTIPALRFNDECFELLARAKLSQEERRTWKELATQAHSFVHAIELRLSTILAVARTIVEAQADFFDQGPAALHPLTMLDVAQTLGCSESTVSRAVSGKYLQSANGTFELKYFFAHSVAGFASGDVSVRLTQERLRELIAAEDPANPLSDTQIAQRLSDEGYPLARRTVAKYRDLAGIPARSLRRRL